jgi:hypothetical protein
VLLPAGAFVIVLGLLLAGRGRRREEDDLPRGSRNSDNGERTPEERRRMHEERMARRRERAPSRKDPGQ